MKWPTSEDVNTSANLRRLNESFPCSYTIWKDTSTTPATYRGESNVAGQIDYPSASVHTVLDNCLNALVAEGGGKILFKRGIYEFTTQPTINGTHDNIHLQGEGWGSILKIADSANVNLLRPTGTAGNRLTNFTVSDLQLDGNRTNNTSSIYTLRAEYCDHLNVHDVYVGSNVRSGIRVEDSTYVNLTSNHVYDCRIGIMVDHYVYDSVVSNNICESNHGTHGISVYEPTARLSITGNVCSGNVGVGISAKGSGGYLTIVGNTTYNNGAGGIYLENDAPDTLISANTSSNDTGIGILTETNEHRIVVTGNNVNSPSLQGIYLQGDYSVASGNIVYHAGKAGIQWNGDYGLVTGNLSYDSQDTKDGVNVAGNYNKVMGNYSIGNTGDGISVSGDNNSIEWNHTLNNTNFGLKTAATADATRILNNYLSGNGSTIADNGSNTVFAKIMVPFVDGTAADDRGWDIDAVGEYARAYMNLPGDVNQVVWLTVTAVSMLLEADAMELDVDVYAAADNEAYDTHSYTVNGLDSTTTNFAANDLIRWRMNGGDILSMVGGDNIEVKVIGAVAAGANCATDARFRTVEAEYV